MNFNLIIIMYDLAIIWAWSAWLPAWIYASRYKIKNVIIGEMFGWALTQSHLVANYPWYEAISWKELMDKFLEHARASWSEILNEKAINISIKNDLFEITLSSWNIIQTKKVIVAIGNKYRKLWLPEEENYIWKWVSYCATCDGMFFRNREVAIVWWGNTALTEALYLSEICKKVYIIHRKNSFRAENVLIETAKKHENIEFVMESNVTKINWWLFLESVELNSSKVINVDGLFVAIGNEPDTRILDELSVKLDEEGYIIVDARQETNISWLYAAWDITTNSNKFKQTLISAAEWALSAASVHEDLLKS